MMVRLSDLFNHVEEGTNPPSTPKRSRGLGIGNVAACALFVGALAVGFTTWGGPSAFDHKFSWAESSYSAERAYESQSYQAQEELESENRLSEGEGETTETSDNQLPTSGDASLAGSKVVGNDEVIVGEGGEAEGGKPSGSENRPGGGEGDTPAPPLDDPYESETIPDRIGDPSRFDDTINPSEDDIAGEQRKRISQVDIQTHGKAYIGQTIQRIDQASPYFDGVFTYTDPKSGKVLTQPLSIANLSIHASIGPIQASDEATMGRTWKVACTAEGFNTVTATLTYDVYHHRIQFENVHEYGTNARRFFNDEPKADGTGNETYQIGDDIWRAVLASLPHRQDGSLDEIFRGWTVDGKAGVITYELAYDPKGQDRDLVLKESFADPATGERDKVPSWLTVEVRGGTQTVTAIDPTYAGVGGVWNVPVGVNALAFDAAQRPNENITRIVVPETVKDIDVNSVVKAFPNLIEWEVDPANRWYTAVGMGVGTGANYLAARLDDPDKLQLVSVPPAVNVAGGIVITPEVVSLGAHAFEGIDFSDSGLILQFDSDEVTFEDWDSIPSGASVVTPFNTPGDIAHMRYLSAIRVHRPDVNILEPIGLNRIDGVYEVDDEGTVIFVYDEHSAHAGERLACYLPLTSSGVVTLSDGITALDANALIDHRAMSADPNAETGSGAPEPARTIVLPASLESVDTRSLDLPSLEMVVVGNRGAATFAHPVFGALSSYRTGITVYFAGNSSDPGYASWRAEIAASFGASAADDIIICLDADGIDAVETDAETGAVYLNQVGRRKLVDIPAATTSIVLHPDTKEIVPTAFAGCTALTWLVLPDAVDTVGTDAFAGCTSLEALLYPPALIREGETTASWMAQVGLDVLVERGVLQLIDSTDAYTHDEYGAFYALRHAREQGLELAYLIFSYTGKEGTLALLDNTTYIRERVAAGNTHIEAVTGFASVREIGARAFEGCSALKKVDDFGALSVLGDRAFANCAIVGALNITGDNLIIGTESFAQCVNVEDVTFTGSIRTLGSSTFAGCRSLVNANLGEEGSSITTTGINTFAQCTNLQAAKLDGSIETIGPRTFADCTTLRKITFNGALECIKVIDDEAFKNCVKLDAIPLRSFTALTTIGTRAFAIDQAQFPLSEALRLDSIMFGVTLTSIGDEAFANQDQLKSVRLKSGSSERERLVIGASAFTGCKALGTVDLSQASSPLTVGVRAFSGCQQLTSVYLPASTDLVADGAFSACTSLKGVTLKGARAFGTGVFDGCSGLLSIDLSITTLGALPESTFKDCTKLSFALMPASLKTIERDAFASCTALSIMSVVFTEVPPVLHEQAFRGCAPRSISVQVPESAGDVFLQRYQEAWQDSAFKELISSETGLISTGKAIYRQDANGFVLLEVTANDIGFEPDANTYAIAPGAFVTSNTIRTIALPASVKEIPADAFRGCTQLESVIFEADRPPTFKGDPFTSVSSAVKIYVTTGATNWYGSLPQLEKYRIVTGGYRYGMDAGIGSIFTMYEQDAASSSFMVLMHIPKNAAGAIALPEQTKYIADGAAEGCMGITSVNVSKCITIGRRAFKGCTSLVTANTGDATNNIPQGIGEAAFEGCTQLTMLSPGSSTAATRLPSGLSKIGPYAFKDCVSLKSLGIQGLISEIPEEMFAGCTSFQSLSYGGSSADAVTKLGDYCFKDCTSMTTQGASLASNPNLVSIGKGTYEGCTNLSLAVFPASLTSIGEDAFKDCAIDVVVFNNDKTLIDISKTGLALEQGNSRVFVPTGMKQAYIAAWGIAPDSPAAERVKDISSQYRSISGNLYAEYNKKTQSSADLEFLASAIRGASKVSVYERASMPLCWITPNALEGVASVTTFATGAYFGHREQYSGNEKPSDVNIGSRAFAGTGGGRAFTLDMSKVTSAEIKPPTLGDHIFGDTPAPGTSILVPSARSQEYLDALSVKLEADYPGWKLVDQGQGRLELVEGARDASADDMNAEEEQQESDVLAPDGSVQDVDADVSGSASADGANQEATDDTEVAGDAQGKGGAGSPADATGASSGTGATGGAGTTGTTSGAGTTPAATIGAGATLGSADGSAVAQMAAVGDNGMRELAS